MRRVMSCFVFAVVSSVCFAQAIPQEVVAEWISVHAGDKRSYSHERRDDVGDAIYHKGRFVGGKLRISRWETEETVTGFTPVLAPSETIHPGLFPKEHL